MSRETPCTDCGAVLPVLDGPQHRYLGASAACWAVFSALNNAGDPPLAPGAHNGLITDAYAVQHPGEPSPQAIQSVAVHLLVLYAVFDQGLDPVQALDVRIRALGRYPDRKRDRFHWLTPPSSDYSLTIADVAAATTPEDRTATAERWIEEVWRAWSIHRSRASTWFDLYVYPDR